MKAIRIYCNKDSNSTTDFSFDPIAFDFLALSNNLFCFGMFFFGLCLFMSKKLSCGEKFYCLTLGRLLLGFVGNIIRY